MLIYAYCDFPFIDTFTPAYLNISTIRRTTTQYQ